MKCGIDVGSTLIKAVSGSPNKGYIYRSTQNMTKQQLIDALVLDEIDEVLVTGIGVYDLPFPRSPIRNNHPLSEIQMQVIAAGELLRQNQLDITDYCLVSIGTGISYTDVDGDYHRHLPVGNPIGGGYMIGMGRMLLPHIGDDAKSIIQEINRVGNLFLNRSVFNEKHPDLLYKDVDPVANDNIVGEMVIASCANMTSESSDDARCFSIANTVAVGIIKDIMMYKSCNYCNSNNVVCIGTASRYEIIQKLLQKYGNALGLTFHFPMWGEYAGALGALIKMHHKAEIEKFSTK